MMYYETELIMQTVKSIAGAVTQDIVITPAISRSMSRVVSNVSNVVESHGESWRVERRIQVKSIARAVTQDIVITPAISRSTSRVVSNVVESTCRVVSNVSNVIVVREERRIQDSVGPDKEDNEVIILSDSDESRTVRVTTQHDNSMVITKRKKGGGVREQIQKPTAIADYKRRNRMRKETRRNRRSSTDRKNIWPGEPEYIALVPPAPRLDPISRLVGGFQDHELDALSATSNKLFPTRVC